LHISHNFQQKAKKQTFPILYRGCRRFP